MNELPTIKLIIEEGDFLDHIQLNKVDDCINEVLNAHEQHAKKKVKDYELKWAKSKISYEQYQKELGKVELLQALKGEVKNER